jgi:hypothetical protein
MAPRIKNCRYFGLRNNNSTVMNTKKMGAKTAKYDIL